MHYTGKSMRDAVDESRESDFAKRAIMGGIINERRK